MNEEADTSQEESCYDRECECEAPPQPSPEPECPGEAPDTSGSLCIPDDEISRREREVAAAKAEAEGLAKELESKNKALADLKTRADELKKALEAHEDGKETRENSEAACREFIECKDPGESECVDGLIDQYKEQVEAYEEYIRYLIWAVGHASVYSSQAEYRHDRAEEHYEEIKQLGSDCLGACSTLSDKHTAAVQNEDKNLVRLYYRLAEERLQFAEKHCLDAGTYEKKLCEAFDALSKSKDQLTQTQSRQKELEDQLDMAKNAYETLVDNEISILEDRIKRCCVDADDTEPADEDESSTDQPVGKSPSDDASSEQSDQPTQASEEVQQDSSAAS